MSRRGAAAILALGFALAICACGQKGALYLPGKAHAAVPKPVQPAAATTSTSTTDALTGTTTTFDDANKDPANPPK